MSKTFALDYDGTYTADPELWLEFIKLAQARGHTVLLVTMRTPNELDDLDPRLTDLIHQIIPTSRRAKSEYLKMFDVVPDIWIDDQPYFLYENGAAVLPKDAEYDLICSLKNKQI